MNDQQSIETSNYLSNVISKIWNATIKDRFSSGLLTYESHLHSELYYQLRLELGQEFELFYEPKIYFRDEPKTEYKTILKKKPDIIVAKGGNIIAIIELKNQPWGEVNYKVDLEKLNAFEYLARDKVQLVLGWKPTREKWAEQKKADELVFTIDENILLVFAVICSKVKKSIAIEKFEDTPKKFLHLVGYIGKNELVFDQISYS